jgi:MoaA/NifB/PqqE/SkfB family radical SAM enzyme
VGLAGPKSDNFFMELVPYLSKLANQVTIGSYGEPLLYPEFVRDFSHSCFRNRLICNMTTNGDIISAIRKRRFRKIKVVKQALSNLTMVSLSFNENIIKNQEDYINFCENVKWLKQNFPDLLVSVNYLVSKRDFENDEKDRTEKTELKNKTRLIFGAINFVNIVDGLMSVGVDNVYALYPKNYPLDVDIVKIRWAYTYLIQKNKNFYVDDLTRKLLEIGINPMHWETPCHYGKGVICIHMNGAVAGCSFESKPLTTLKKPKDILRLKTLKIKKRYSCPFLKLAKRERREKQEEKVHGKKNT